MIVRIYQDSHQPPRRAQCRSCGASIEWAETFNGKKMPFDFPIVVVKTTGHPLRDGGRILEEVDTDVSASHFATCPDGKKWSHRGHGRRQASRTDA